jgi:hypothetical protein
MFGEINFALPPSPVAAKVTKATSLQSWKEISVYTGKGVRTLQRWERRNGFPIHRPGGHARSAVFALQSEVDPWMLEFGSHPELRVSTEGLGLLRMREAEHRKAIWNGIRELAAALAILHRHCIRVGQERERLQVNTSTLTTLKNSVRTANERYKHARLARAA